MKKLITTVLLLSLFVHSAFALDLQSMTTDELINLEREIRDEINSRTKGIAHEVHEGLYICGVDIAPGSYTFRFYGFEDPDYHTQFSIYESLEDRKEYDELIDYFPYKDDVIHFTLTEGMVAYLASGSGEIVRESTIYSADK